jgi:signal transduction histidine kinase/FixJ family two-component response regulator
LNRTVSERAVILAPLGRDAVVAEAMLREGGFEASAVRDVLALAETLRTGAGFAIVTEEALNAVDLRPLTAFLADQAEWSDFPFIVLTSRGGGLERNPAAVRLLETLGNVTFLERPFHPTSLISLARAARRARLRQYEARQRLEEIRDAEQLMALALSSGALAAWSVDLKTDELTTSAEGKAHYGLGPDDPFTLDDLRARIHPDDLPQWRDAVARTITTGRDLDVQYRCLWPDGSIHWVQVNGRVERDSRDKPLRMVGVTQDVTARRSSENRRTALLELGDRLRQTTDPAEMSFLAAEILGKTLAVSRAGYGVIDLAEETITIERDWNMPGTTSLAGTLHFRDYGSYIEDLKRGETVTISDSRTDPRTAETSEALENIDARAVLNMPLIDHNNLVALLYLNHKHARQWTRAELAFVRDVADRTQAAIERRLAEKALEDLAQSLEHLVEKRTRESEAVHEQLRQAQKMESIGQLTGGVAHDFNNLLMAIRSSLELLERRLPDGDRRAQDFLANAIKATERGASLTQRMLAFARKQELDARPVDVGALVTGMRDLLERSLGPQIAITVTIADGVADAMIDANQLEMAVLNLAVNARDAMEGTGKLDFAIDQVGADCAAGLADGDYVRLRITDNGPGMDAETRERAMEPFFTTKGVGRGTGLGLSMVHGLAVQSGGTFELHSAPGEGTTAEIYLPVAQSQPKADTPAEPAPRARALDRSLTVLAVDDDALVLLGTAGLLEDFGHRVLEAHSGAQALDLIDAHPEIDLVITDQAMPNMTGVELASEISRRRPGLPIVLASGYAEMPSGAPPEIVARLEKPFSDAALSEALFNVLAAADCE